MGGHNSKIAFGYRQLGISCLSMIPGGLAWRAWHKGIEEPARERQRQDYITGTQRYVDDFNDDVNRFREEDASKTSSSVENIAMLVYNLYLYNRKGECLYYEQWDRESVPPDLEEEHKLMYGLLYSLKAFVSKTSSLQHDSLKYLTTSTYKMHFYESLSGIKFVLLTDAQAGNLAQYLKEIHAYYVQYCTKNPLYNIGEPITCDTFKANVQALVTKLHSVA